MSYKLHQKNKTIQYYTKKMQDSFLSLEANDNQCFKNDLLRYGVSDWEK